jgi:hypothetical protein
MSRTRLTLSSEPTQGHNEGCLIKPRGRNPDIARLMRDDYDEVRLNAAGGDPAVENLAGRTGKDAQKYGFVAERRFDGSEPGARLDRRLSVRPASGLIF